MKNISKTGTYLAAALTMLALGACSDFEPAGLPEVPGMETVKDLKADIAGHNINLSWNLPSSESIEGVMLITNGNFNNAKTLEGRPTSHTIVGQPMDEEYMYTVKVLYDGGFVSEGVSVKATLPYEELAGVSNLRADVDGRTVTLSWTLPSAGDITGIRVLRDGEPANSLDGRATGCVLKGQPMDRKLTYTVEAIYEGFYASKAATVTADIPYIAPRMGYLMTAASIAELPDDDERAAASWFISQENAELVWPEQLADLDADIYSVLWIEIDRVGLPMGWQNLPAEISNESTIAALRDYSARGGSLYLSNMATQLTEPLGFVPEGYAPTVYGNGEGGRGDDVWVLNAYLGWDFRNGSDQGFYDRTGHDIYKDLTFEDPNGYGYPNLPLIGPGQREDHNCLWDCNIYGRGDQPDVIRNFELTTNSQVLATWGHVRDHCVAGMVDFYSNSEHGRCIANGLAAYEWNQNSGPNPYQGNIEKMTSNILDYLK